MATRGLMRYSLSELDSDSGSVDAASLLVAAAASGFQNTVIIILIII